MLLELSHDRSLPVHLARPSKTGAPSVLVLHEIMGLNDDIRRITQRFADAGYLAMAPDLFHGRGSMPLCIARTMAEIRRGEGPLFDDLQVARQFLLGHPDSDGQRIGVIGFCMGGGFALALGSLGGFGAAAPFYGDTLSDEKVAKLCPVVGGYGARDYFFARQGRALKRQLEANDIVHDVQIYDGVGHSFMSEIPGWQRPVSMLSALTPFKWSPDAEAAEDSWRRVLSFFDTHLAP